MMPYCVRSLLLLWACLVQVQAFVMLCYFTNWAHNRESTYSRFDVDHIDPSLCTHLVYAFAAIDVGSPQIVPINKIQDPGRYTKFNNIKKNHSHIKTLLSIGGEYARHDRFVVISQDDYLLQTFARNAVDFLRDQGFDGLDIDWEYPNAATKAHFSRLLEALRTTFEAEQTQGERLLLTATLPAGRHRIQDGYDIAVINRSVDLASLMTYDYHGAWNSVTGFDSPLFPRKSNPQFNQELSTNWTVHYYLSHGLAASKILVGVTAAGTHFRLQNLSLTGVGAPVRSTDSTSLDGPLWKLPGRYAYPEICQVLNESNSQRVFDEEQQVPYAYRNHDWFGYEDVQSVEGKVAWMQKKGVAGAMFWALDMDDFTGALCGQGTFPLLRAFSKKEEEEEEEEGKGQNGEGTDDTDLGTVNTGSWILCLALLVLRLFCR